MAEQGRTFPSPDDPARYDRIIERGRSLRRRRRFGMGAGAGGSAAAVALAVVLVTGNGSRTEQIVADGDRVPVVDSTTTTTTTTTPPPPEELTVTVDAGPEEITVTVIDPEHPVSEDSRQCITVSVIGDTGDTAELHTCNDDQGDIVLPSTGGVLIGCSATLSQPEPGAPTEFETESSTTVFVLDTPEELAPGAYTVDVGATSGIGDGCAGTGDEAALGEPLAPGATERSVTVSATFTID